MTADVQIVRYRELVPCRTAFIDTHTPGSDQKENYTIIGGGVSESPDQHVHIQETPGFNIGAAAQPAGCTNSLHSHRTAEVFMIHSGQWRIFWGVRGNDGETIMNPGDFMSVPTHLFRGFENISKPTESNPSGYGFLFVVLGGDDSGGGVTWDPAVIETAKKHGLILLENGRLSDIKNGETIPEGMQPMPRLSSDELKFYGRNLIHSEAQVIVRRHDSTGTDPVKLLGKTADALIREKPGFEISRIQWDAQNHRFCIPRDKDTILICNEGQALLDQHLSINAGDVVFVKMSEHDNLILSSRQGGEFFIITPTDDIAGETTYL